MTPIICWTISVISTRKGIERECTSLGRHSGYGMFNLHAVVRPLTFGRDIAAKVTPEQHEEAMRKVEVFRSWFLHQIMAIDEQNTLVLLPIEKLESRYRDETPALPSEAPKGVSMLFVSPALKAPELVVPSMCDIL